MYVIGSYLVNIDKHWFYRSMYLFVENNFLNDNMNEISSDGNGLLTIKDRDFMNWYILKEIKWTTT